jgi:hypothetical protein
MQSPYRIPGRVLPQARPKRRWKLTPTRLLLAIVVAVAGFVVVGSTFVSCALMIS